MFTLFCLLGAVYIVLRVLNTRARFAEEDARREAEEQAAMAEAEEEAEDAMMRAEAIDVEPEVVDSEPAEAK